MKKGRGDPDSGQLTQRPKCGIHVPESLTDGYGPTMKQSRKQIGKQCCICGQSSSEAQR